MEDPMPYVDGFLLPVSGKHFASYRRMARLGGRIFREHGALEYRECVGDDLKASFGLSFLRSVKAKRGERVLFSWIVYRSRAHRDRVNARVMKDPRMSAMMEGYQMPFDIRRMYYGGFKTLVDL
jgi:uncharacterized protein YbaA (DUF1428 family)